MPKPKKLKREDGVLLDPTERVAIELSTSGWAAEALLTLADSGRFGETPEAVAEELLRAKLREVEREGWLEK